MHFKMYIPITILLIAANYILILAANEKLDLYIHPRYILFTILLTIIGAVIILAGVILNNNKQAEKISISITPILIVLALAILLPASSLTSATFSQRNLSSQPIINQGPTISTSGLFANSSKILSLNDWHRLLATNQDPEYYTNRIANFSGFIFDPNLGTDLVWIARFQVSCCAVDAQPLGIPVKIEGWQSKFKQDDWVEVEGKFQTLTTNSGDQLVLVPSSVQKIEEPSNPYAN